MPLLEDLISAIFNIGGNHPKALADMIRQATDAQKAMSGLQNVFDKFNTVVLGGALAFSVSQVVKLNKELEDTKYRLAGSIGAAGFTKNFADSMLLARVSMKQIREEAARLPGTEQDFLAAFSIAMPALKDMGMTELPKMISLSNNLMAVAKSQGIDTPQAARDVMYMARGHAGADVRSFEAMKSAMGIKTAQEFNRLSPDKRMAALYKVVAAYAPLLQNFENTWEAIASTAESYAKTTMRAFSEPMFNAVKNLLGEMNKSFGEMQEHVLLIAEYLGTRMVDGVRAAYGLMTGALGAPSPATSRSIPVMSGGAQPVNSFVQQGAASAAYFGRAFEALMPALTATKDAFWAVYQAGVDLVEPWLVPLGMAAELVAQAFGGVWTVVMDAVSLLGNEFGPMLRIAGEALGLLARVIGYGAQIIFQTIGKWYEQAKSWMAQNTLTRAFAFEKAGQDASSFFGNLNKSLDSIMGQFGAANGYKLGGLLGTAGEEQSRLLTFQQRRMAQEAADAAQAAMLGTNMKKGRPQVQINNVFNINSQFAPGYDPDRIATAMRNDINRVSARRMESPLTVLFQTL